jgi:hypothetical protein
MDRGKSSSRSESDSTWVITPFGHSVICRSETAANSDFVVAKELLDTFFASKGSKVSQFFDNINHLGNPPQMQKGEKITLTRVLGVLRLHAECLN